MVQKTSSKQRFGGIYSALSQRDAMYLQEFIDRSESPGYFSELDLNNTSISDLIAELEDEVDFMSEILGQGGGVTPGEMPWYRFGFEEGEEQYLQYRRDIVQVGYIIGKLKAHYRRFFGELE